MKKTATAFTTERRHLLEIIDGLIEGIILLDNNRHIAWANDTALAMHGVADLAGWAARRPAIARRTRCATATTASWTRRNTRWIGRWRARPSGDMVVEVCSRRDPDFAACTRCATWC